MLDNILLTYFRVVLKYQDIKKRARKDNGDQNKYVHLVLSFMFNFNTMHT